MVYSVLIQARVCLILRKLLEDYSIEYTDELRNFIRRRDFCPIIARLHSHGHRFEDQFILLLARTGKIQPLRWFQSNGYRIKWDMCLLEARKNLSNDPFSNSVGCIRFLEEEIRKEEIWTVWNRYNGENSHDSWLEWPPEEVMESILELLEK